jgi:xylulokinase
MIFLGLDVGSTGCKCVAFLDNGNELASHYCEYPTISGQADLNPNMLRTSVLEVISGCAAKVDNRSDIVSITVSSFGESFVSLGEDGEPTSNIIMYYADRAQSELEQMVDAVGAERIMGITRAMPDTMYSAPKMMWTIRNQKTPVRKFLLIADYICYVLTGEYVTDYSLAARTMLFDPIRLDWTSDLLNAAGISKDKLPSPVPTGTIIGKVLPKVADEAGLPLNTKVVIGAHDQVVNALGAGVLEAGDSVDGTGTVECITPLFTEIPSDLSFIRNNYVTIPYLRPGNYVTYAFNFSGGSLVKWFRDTLAIHLKSRALADGVSSYELLDKQCATTPTDLLVIPHFQGAGGTPDMAKSAKGLIYGLTMDTGMSELYRAVMEGLTYEMAYNLEVLSEFGISTSRMFAAGGGARSSIWLQIKADILNKEIVPVRSEEAGALGGAILAASSIGLYGSIEQAVRHFVKYKDAVVPNDKVRSHYTEKYGEYKELRKFALSRIIGV